MLAIIVVRQLPPKESLSSRVSLESQYGTCLLMPFSSLVLSALMQLPKERRDLLILAPSSSRYPLFWEAAALSLPARSMKLSLAERISWFAEPLSLALFSTLMIRTAWERLETSFAAVLSVVQRLLPSSKDFMISSAFVIIMGSPVTQTPLIGSSLKSWVSPYSLSKSLMISL